MLLIIIKSFGKLEKNRYIMKNILFPTYKFIFILIFFSRKQCIYSDSRLYFLKELVKNIPDISEGCNDINFSEESVKKKKTKNNNSDEEE